VIGKLGEKLFHIILSKIRIAVMHGPNICAETVLDGGIVNFVFPLPAITHFNGSMCLQAAWE